MTRPNISKFQESEIRRAAKAAHLHYLASLPRPLHPGAPAEDEAADAEFLWDRVATGNVKATWSYDKKA